MGSALTKFGEALTNSDSETAMTLWASSESLQALDPRAPYESYSTNPNENTFLHLTCYCGVTEIVVAYLKMGGGGM